MEVYSMKQNYHYFVLFLLNGISDDSKDISVKCQILLEDHGNKMREVYKVLGEDEEQKMDVDSDGVLGNK
jgi:hypothetical protein